jgi:hypothetical protein
MNSGARTNLRSLMSPLPRTGANSTVAGLLEREDNQPRLN